MNQVPTTVRHEGVAKKRLWVSVAAINAGAGGACKISGSPTSPFDGTGHKSRHTPARSDHPPRFLGTNSIHLGRWTIHSDARERGRHRIERVAGSVNIVIQEK